MNKVLQLVRPTLDDIPRVLRAIADELESGTYGDVVAGVLAIECSSGVLQLFGAGQADRHRALAIATGAQHILTQRIYGVCAEQD
jgi:hypothetical protein